MKDLRTEIFDQGIREVLEDTSILKLMFDCRRDSDALWHIFKVKLANVMDIQLMQIFYERTHPDEKSQEQKDREGRFTQYSKDSAEQRTLYEWPWLRGLACCITWYLKDSSLLVMKQGACLNTKTADPEQWRKRPLSQDMLLYATIDVSTLFKLYDKFTSGLDATELQTAQTGSSRYLSFFREQTSIVPNPYEDQRLLPMYILDDPPAQASQRACSACTLTFTGSDIGCDGLCKLCRIKKYKIEREQKRHQRHLEYLERERKRVQRKQERQNRYHEHHDDHYDYGN
jgi:hypothetical protein